MVISTAAAMRRIAEDEEEQHQGYGCQMRQSPLKSTRDEEAL
jgi:hypothetical protein